MNIYDWCYLKLNLFISRFPNRYSNSMRGKIYLPVPIFAINCHWSKLTILNAFPIDRCTVGWVKRGMQMWGFLYPRAHNSVTWCPILMKFCMQGSFLVYLWEGFWYTLRVHDVQHYIHFKYTKKLPTMQNFIKIGLQVTELWALGYRKPHICIPLL